MGWRERERFKTHTGWIRFELLSVFSPILCCFDTIGQPRGPSKYHRHVLESVGLLTVCMSLSQSQGMKQMIRQDSQAAHTRNLKTDPHNRSLLKKTETSTSLPNTKNPSQTL